MRDRFLTFLYETTADSYEGEAGGDEGEAPVPEGGWPGPSQDEWNDLVGFRQEVTPFLGELANVLNQVEQPQYGQQQQPQYGQDPYAQQEPEFDPFDSNSVQQYIQQNIQQGVQQALDPYSGVLGLVATREGEQLAKNELDTIKSEVGDFDQDAALLVASGLIDQGQDPSQALRTSAEYVRDYEAKIRASEREKYQQELQGLSGRGDVPAGAGNGAEPTIPIPTGQDRYRVAVENALARRRPGLPV
jgi:hypothetical protein